MTRTRRAPRDPDAMAVAIRRGEWERIALYLLVGAAEAVRTAQPGTIDDLLALLSKERDDDR